MNGLGGYFNIYKGGMSDNGMGSEDNEIFNKIKDVDFITGCALFISVDVVKSIGAFDTEYFYYA